MPKSHSSVQHNAIVARVAKEHMLLSLDELHIFCTLICLILLSVLQLNLVRGRYATSGVQLLMVHAVLISPRPRDSRLILYMHTQRGTAPEPTVPPHVLCVHVHVSSIHSCSEAGSSSVGSYFPQSASTMQVPPVCSPCCSPRLPHFVIHSPALPSSSTHPTYPPLIIVSLCAGGFGGRRFR